MQDNFIEMANIIIGFCYFVFCLHPVQWIEADDSFLFFKYQQLFFLYNSTH